MANEIRARANGVAGSLSADLTSGGTTMTSAALADLPVIDTTNHAAITLFQTATDGRVTKQEIVWVTAHTSAATTATISRGQEGTTGQAWNGTSAPDKWIHAPTTRDYPGAFVLLKRAAAQSIPDSTWTACTFDQEEFDDAGLHSTTTNTSRITFAAAGTFLVGGNVSYAIGVDQIRVIVAIYKNGTIFGGRAEVDASGTTGGQGPFLVMPIRAAAGDYVELFTFHNAGSATNVDNTLTRFWAARLSA